MICERIKECKKELNKPKDTFVDKIGCNSRYLIENKDRRTYYKIDFENCVYHDRKNDTKCDYGMIVNESVVFIELKGSDVKKGISQLLSTVNETKNCFNGMNLKARLIVSRNTAPNITTRSKDYRDLVRITNNPIIIKKDQYTEKI